MNKTYSGKCERNINYNNWCSGCRHVSRDSDPGHIKCPVYEGLLPERDVRTALQVTERTRGTMKRLKANQDNNGRPAAAHIHTARK